MPPAPASLREAGAGGLGECLRESTRDAARSRPGRPLCRPVYGRTNASTAVIFNAAEICWHVPSASGSRSAD
jgi:hypothetical protein